MLTPALTADSDSNHIECGRCGYDLRAHEIDSSCPECGLPIALSSTLRGSGFRSYRQVRLVRLALSLVVVAIFLYATYLPAFVIWTRTLWFASFRWLYWVSFWWWRWSGLAATVALILAGLAMTAALRLDRSRDGRWALIWISTATLGALVNATLALAPLNSNWWDKQALAGNYLSAVGWIGLSAVMVFAGRRIHEVRLWQLGLVGAVCAALNMIYGLLKITAISSTRLFPQVAFFDWWRVHSFRLVLGSWLDVSGVLAQIDYAFTIGLLLLTWRAIRRTQALLAPLSPVD